MIQKLFGFLTLVWMAVIFWFSAQNAGESSEMSLEIGKAVGHVLVEEYDNWPAEQQISFAEQIEFPIRKMAHASEYALLGLLLMGFYNGRWSYAFFIGVVYAAGDEFHQLFVPRRSGQLSDVCIDCIGVVLGIFVFYVCRRVICEKR